MSLHRYWRSSGKAFTYNDLGQRAPMSNASGTTNYIYDSRNCLQSKQTPEGNLSHTFVESGSIKTLRSNHAGGVSVDKGMREERGVRLAISSKEKVKQAKLQMELTIQNK